VLDHVVIALDGAEDGRDALILGAQLCGSRGRMIVAHVLVAPALDLADGPAADRPRQRAHDVYATLGPDARARYLPMAGRPLTETLCELARRERTDLIVAGQRLFARGRAGAALLARAPCAVAVAPHGHRFRRGYLPERVALGTDDPAAVRFAARLGEVASASDRADLLVIGSAPEPGVLAQAPVPIVAAGR
jgi:nucleotide-binding universal stress UspA family protein